MKKLIIWITALVVVLGAGCRKDTDRKDNRAVATFHCDATEVFVDGTQTTVPVTIRLDRAPEQSLPLAIVYDTQNTITEGWRTDIEAEEIRFDKGGGTELTFNLVYDPAVFEAGVAGVSHLRISSDLVRIGNPSSVRLNVAGVNKATLSTEGLDVVVGDADFEKTVTVTLSAEASADAVFDLHVASEEGGVEIVDRTITIPKGQKSGSGSIRFLKKDYPIELQTGTAVVSVSTATTGVSTAEAGNLVLRIRGTGRAPAAQLDRTEDVVKVPLIGDLQYNFAINLTEALDKEVLIRATAECDKPNGYSNLRETISIPKGHIQGFGIIAFSSNTYPYDTDQATVTLRISSDDVIVLHSGSTLKLKVSGSRSDPNKQGTE